MIAEKTADLIRGRVATMTAAPAEPVAA